MVGHPSTLKLTDLIVEGGHVRHGDRMLPISTLDRTMDDDFYLPIADRQLTKSRYRS